MGEDTVTLNGKIVFSSGLQLDSDIWSLDLSSGYLAQLTHGENINSYPRWSPDGKWIAYISIQDDLVPSIWVMNSRGTENRRLTRAIYCHGPNWSPDGSRIIFSGNVEAASEIDICSIAPDGTALTRLFGVPGLETSPSLSPDGMCILFSAPTSDSDRTLTFGNRDIIEYHLTTKSKRLICAHPARDDSPVYSPNGSQIAFISYRSDQTDADVEQSLADYRRALMSDSNAAGHAAIRKMKGACSDGDIFIVHRDGSNLRRLATDAFYASGVAWSPCGQYLIYSGAARDIPGTSRLTIVEAESGQQVDFTYDRTKLENSLETARVAKLSPLMNLVPGFVARHLLPKDLWGAEQTPHWIAAR
ncbi:MAG: TolB family protein [Pseudomonadota bacterium]